jgi:uncharacterized DUF497 family protein
MRAGELRLGQQKNLRNLRLHGIAFEDAVKIFDYGETRVYAIGVTNGVEVGTA